MKNNFKEISFYHLTTLPMMKAAPKLIEKIYQAENRILVITEDPETAKTLDNVLWSYSSKTFIPHATYQDEYQEDQPIYITVDQQNLNQANVIMALGQILVDNLVSEKLFLIFDGNQQEQLDFARKQWKSYQHMQPKYWQQKPDGSWEKNS